MAAGSRFSDVYLKVFYFFTVVCVRIRNVYSLLLIYVYYNRYCVRHDVTNYTLKDVYIITELLFEFFRFDTYEYLGVVSI